MKKLFKLVRMELQNSPQGPVIQLHFTDWQPETERVNPAKERIQQSLRALKEAGDKIPKDILAVIEGLADMADPTNYGYMVPNLAYYSTSVISVSPKEYEALGKPMLGSILGLELAKAEEVE